MDQFAFQNRNEWFKATENPSSSIFGQAVGMDKGSPCSKVHSSDCFDHLYLWVNLWNGGPLLATRQPNNAFLVIHGEREPRENLVSENSRAVSKVGASHHICHTANVLAYHLAYPIYPSAKSTTLQKIVLCLFISYKGRKACLHSEQEPAQVVKAECATWAYHFSWRYWKLPLVQTGNNLQSSLQSQNSVSLRHLSQWHQQSGPWSLEIFHRLRMSPGWPWAFAPAVGSTELRGK